MVKHLVEEARHALPLSNPAQRKRAEQPVSSRLVCLLTRRGRAGEHRTANDGYQERDVGVAERPDKIG